MPSDDHPADAVLAALAVKLRRDVLRLVSREGPVSPKVAADAVGLPLPNVSYHFKILREVGLIDLVATAPRRGAVEHFYRRGRKNAAKVDELLAIADSLR